jgi:cell division protein FtsZ
MNPHPDPLPPDATPEVPVTEFLVAGVGHAGGAIVERLAATGLSNARFLAADTDATSLGRLAVADRVNFGVKATRREGCGNDLPRGAQAAEADAALLKEHFRHVRLVCVIVGIGGGVGGGSGPVIARLAREAGALVLAVAVLPFHYEGQLRHNNASEGLQNLRKAADAVICVPNQGVAKMLDEKTLVTEVFAAANDLVAQSVASLWRLLHRPSLNPLGFADLERLLRGRHAESVFAAVETRGPNRVREALDKLQAHPFLQTGQMLEEADAALLAIAGGTDLRFDELQEVQNQFQRLCDHAQVITGSAVDPELDGRLVVTVIATRGGSMPPTASHLASAMATAAAPAEPEPNRTAASESEPETVMQFENPTAEAPAAGRSSPKFVPPAPEISELQKRALVGKQIRNPLRRNKAKQTLFNFDVVSVSRFEKTEPVKRNGENLDEPTYARRGIALN